jgi:hypothetical protein
LKIKTAYVVRFALAACLAALAVSPAGVSAFTQHGINLGKGNVVMMGHEWITRMSAIELLEPNSATDLRDPRRTWPGNQGRAKNLNLDGAKAEVDRIKANRHDDFTYLANYKFVWDAIIGERWVDVGGHNVAASNRPRGAYNCHDVVTQEAAELQYDHYMRRYDDKDAEGGVKAAKASANKFVEYFVAAAMAEKASMKVWDGGGYAALVTVDRNYFLLGRALHLFQDSFSPDHTVRIAQDGFEKVRQVKSYLCAEGSEQHHHHTLPHDTDGDVIWLPGTRYDQRGWGSYIPSNMKDVAIVAAEGSKDVWAAFIRTMALPLKERGATARKEAEALAAQWLALRDEQETREWYRKPENRGPSYVRSSRWEDDGGNGRSQTECMRSDWGAQGEGAAAQRAKAAKFEADRRICLYNMVPTWGSENDFDRSLKLSYNWHWRDRKRYVEPPASWKIGDPLYVKVTIANRANGEHLHEHNLYLYNYERKNSQIAEFLVPLSSVLAPVSETIVLRSAAHPGYHLNRAGTKWGLVALWQSTRKGHFRLERRPDGYYNIKNVDDNMYIYMHTDRQTYLNKDGKPDNPNAQWRIEGIPEPYPMSGNYRNDGAAYTLHSGADGVLTTAPLRGANDLFALERQDDGSYTVKLNGDFIRARPDRHQLSLDKAGGSRFFLDQQQDGSYLLRGEDGWYWHIDERPGSIVSTDARAECPPDPCQTGRSVKGMPLPDECGTRPPPQNACSVATPLQLLFERAR